MSAADVSIPDKRQNQLTRLNAKGITIIVVSPPLLEELRRNAENCGLPLRSFIREILEAEAATLRLPNIDTGEERSQAHLPGSPSDSDSYPFPSPDQCFRVRVP